MTQPLAGFCQLMVEKHGSPSVIKDGVLAREFVEHFWVSVNPTLVEFQLLCKQIGIDVEAKRLPLEIGAHHYFDQLAGKYRLEYEQEQWVGTSEFKIVHDLFEIIQETFEVLYPDYRAPRNRAMPTCMAPHANRFAAAVVMNEDVFRRYAIETGLDVIALHNRFCKSYSSIAIRMVDVLQDCPGDDIQLLIAIYERTETDREPSLSEECSRPKLQARYVLKTPAFKVSRRRWRIDAPRYPCQVIPRKGDGVLPGSIVDLVLETGRPVYLQRASGFDFWGWNDLSFIARPVFWFGKLAKVVVVGVSSREQPLVQSQLDGLTPIVVPESYQLI